MRPTLPALLLVLCQGCVWESGEPGFPGIEGPPLVLAVEPADGAEHVPNNPRLFLRFDRYLDPFAERAATALRLASGKRRVPLRTRWDPVELAVVADPYWRLTSGVAWVLTLDDPSLLVDFRGRTPVEPVEARFFVSAARRVPPAAPSDWAATARDALRESGCTSCHFEGSGVPGLDLTDAPALVHRDAVLIADRELIVPGSANRSYLLHKVLAAYPDRLGEEMPPTDAAGAPFDPGARQDLLRALKGWIDRL